TIWAARHPTSGSKLAPIVTGAVQLAPVDNVHIPIIVLGLVSPTPMESSTLNINALWHRRQWHHRNINFV
ncbi:hypothetical protein, partial [Salinivibrio sp. EAGSL]|uniref:hypothetical protein n=1 Tax=Salinivibrio sp. EAGSL TaxID=2738468 RepID=UPI001C37689E